MLSNTSTVKASKCGVNTVWHLTSSGNASVGGGKSNYPYWEEGQEAGESIPLWKRQWAASDQGPVATAPRGDGHLRHFIAPSKMVNIRFNIMSTQILEVLWVIFHLATAYMISDIIVVLRIVRTWQEHKIINLWELITKLQIPLDSHALCPSAKRAFPENTLVAHENTQYAFCIIVCIPLREHFARTSKISTP